MFLTPSVRFLSLQDRASTVVILVGLKDSIEAMLSPLDFLQKGWLQFQRGLPLMWTLLLMQGLWSQEIETSVGEVTPHIADAETILVKDVRLIGRDGKAEDQLVSILIKKTRLELVTTDAVPEEEGMLVIEAQDRVLLGNLVIGQPASFIILDEDPREQFEVLLDTKTFVSFAIHNGRLVRNRLAAVDVAKSAQPVERPRRPTAYIPPPVSLPLSYQNAGRWNRWDTKYTSGAFVGLAALDRQGWVYQNKASEQQVGDLNRYNGGELRGLRFGVIGSLKFERPWIYTVFASTSAFDRGFDTTTDKAMTLLDLRLDIPLADNVSLAVGKQKEPISMERLMTLIYEPMLERSGADDALLPSRNVGAVLSGTGFGRRMTWAGGVFNDWFIKGQPFHDSGTQFVGRTTWLPYLSQDGSNLVHLGLGIRYTNTKGEQLRYRTEPEFRQAPHFVDTDLLQADNAMTYSLEASWRVGPWWLASEALINDVSAPMYGNPVFHGYHVMGTWSLTGEMRPYDRVSGVFSPLPVAKPITQKGWGAWELATRWSSLDLSEGQVHGGEMGILSVGVNWWPVKAAEFSVNYRHILLKRFAEDGKSDGVLVRLVLILD